MFFSRKKDTTLDLSWLQTDFHSHLIPGIDDGAPDIETSLELIKGLVALGYKKIITTPHILWEMYPNTTEIITTCIAAVRKAVLEVNIPVDIQAAAEYYIDDHFENELRNKIPLLPISENKVLVEFSMLTAPMDLKDVLFEMQMQNYQPVIAHPERYTYLNRKREFLDDLRNSGCLFQVNLLSLTGHYGSSVQDLAEYIIKKNYYDYAGTDLHHSRHLTSLQKLSSSSLFKKLRDSGSLKNHLL